MATEPISLYLDLHEGEVADIEVVARSAIAWSDAIKELAYVIDPSIEVRVGLSSGTPGSLSLNSLIETIRQTTGKHPKLTTVVLTVMTWFALETGQYTYTRVLDYLTGKDAPQATEALSQDEIEEIAREVAEILNPQLARPQREQLYRELERDPTIIGAGVTARPNTRPVVIVPRAEFPSRANIGEAVAETAERRTQIQPMTVTLVSPVLKDVERSWKFQLGALPEFGAHMKDHDFLEGFVRGEIDIPLRAGIEMDIELETKEEFENDVWVVKERNVVRVLRPKRKRDGGLFPSNSVVD